MKINRINKDNVTFVPVYRQIEEYLKNKIINNEIPPLTKLPTIKDMAKEFGVHVVTLEKALDILRGQGLIVSRVGSGTFVSERKENSKLKKMTIGLVLGWTDVSHMATDSITMSIFNGVRNKLRNQFYNLQILNHEWGQKYTDIYGANRLDGMLIMSPQFSHKEDLINLKKIGAKFVLISGPFKNSNIDFVTINSDEIINSAIKYLIGLGHKDIAYIDADISSAVHIERTKEYKTALKKNGLSFKEEYYKYPDSKENFQEHEMGYRGMIEMLKLKQRPTAVICADHLIALGAIDAIRDKGLRIPDDISLMTFAEHELIEDHKPPITLIKTKLGKVAEVATEELIKILNGSQMKPSQVYLETEIVYGETCASPKNRTES